MIIVILPSRNEADSISEVTQIIDQGLITYFSDVQALLLNIDSSDDAMTRNRFLSTQTIFPKKSIRLPLNKIGKGFNLKRGIEYGIKYGYKYFLTFDTDVKSFEPEWVKSYLTELIEKKTDFVLPIYSRNRFEGNTTNHFSNPLIEICWNKPIQQPIAGDFGFSLRQAKNILAAFSLHTDYLYGVDTVMTWSALEQNYKISEVILGSKIHKPSFHKIDKMFKEVCLSTFYRINKCRKKIISNISGNYIYKSSPPLLHEDKNAMPTQNSISRLKEIAKHLNDGENGNFEFDNVDVNLWTDKLSEIIGTLLISNLTNDQLKKKVEYIASYFFARTSGYIEEIQTKTPSEAAVILSKQKKMLAKKIKLINF